MILNIVNSFIGKKDNNEIRTSFIKEFNKTLKDILQ